MENSELVFVLEVEIGFDFEVDLHSIAIGKLVVVATMRNLMAMGLVGPVLTINPNLVVDLESLLLIKIDSKFWSEKILLINLHWLLDDVKTDSVTKE